MAQSIRPRNAEATRSAILSAALSLFAAQGYAGTGVRQIAAAAGVDKMLISRYFRSKKDLFGEAAATVLATDEWFDTDRAQFGERMARRLCGSPKGSHEVDVLQFILRSAADPEAAIILKAVIEERVVGPLASWIGEPSAAERATLLLSELAGFGLITSVLKIDPLGSASPDQLASILAPILQRLIK